MVPYHISRFKFSSYLAKFFLFHSLILLSLSMLQFVCSVACLLIRLCCCYCLCAPFQIKMGWKSILYYRVQNSFLIAQRSTNLIFYFIKKLDKIHKFTGQIDFLLDKLVFFTGRKIPDNYDISTGQKD